MFASNRRVAKDLLQHLRERDTHRGHFMLAQACALWQSPQINVNSAIRQQQLDRVLTLCEESRRMALDDGDRYWQGAAFFHTGLVYVLRGPTAWDGAAIFLRQSALRFSAAAELHEAAAAWLASGMMLELMSRHDHANRWRGALDAYMQGTHVLAQTSDPLLPILEHRLKAVTRKHADWTMRPTFKAQTAQANPPPPTPPRPPVGATSQPNTPSASAPPPAPASAPPTSPNAPVGATPPPITPTPPAPPRPWANIGIAALVVLFLIGILLVIASLLSLTLLRVAVSILGAVVFAACADLTTRWLAGQWVVRLEPERAAIYQYRGRIWGVAQPGTHLTWLFMERVVAIISLATRQIDERFNPLTTQYLWLVPQVKIEYKVADECLAWETIRAALSPHHLLWVERPASVEQTNEGMDAQIRQLAENVLREVANDPSHQNVFNNAGPKIPYLTNLLQSRAATIGLQLTLVEIIPYVRPS